MASNDGNNAEGHGRRLGSVGATWRIVLLCLIPATAYYGWLICLNVGDVLKGPYQGAALFRPVNYGLTFNSMLLHLLHGTFDVDPQTIGLEGAVRDGLTYSYFGIGLALIRLPFLWVRDFASTDFTRLSCLAAVSLMGGFNLASVLTVWRAVGRPERATLLVIVVLAMLIGGAQIQFLMASIWQEVTLWAAAFGSAFVYLVIRGCFSERGFTAGLLAALALAAGLSLLTRVSTALGLYLALGLLMLSLAWRALRTAGRFRAAMLLPFIPAGAILGVFVATAGLVNYQRWGNPLAFAAEIQSYLLASPDRLARDAQYGQFNLIRVGYGLAYYFVPVWAMRAADGNFWWSAFQQRTIDSVELPPSSFFISDPVLIALAASALTQLVRRRGAVDHAVAVPVLAGLFVPIGLILTYTTMAFRYRLEFYPFLDLCGFLGFGVLLSRPKKPPLAAFAVAAIVGVVASHALWVLYVIGRYGDATEKLSGMDLLSFYRSFFQ